MAAASTVEEYIGGFPPEVRVQLLRLRETIRQVVPNGVETMTDMPTIMVEGEPAIRWAAAKKNLTIHGTDALPPALEREAVDYRYEADVLQFPYRKGLPFELIADVVKHLAATRR